MIVLVCGSRWWTDTATIHLALEHLSRRPEPLTVIEGGAKGADRIAGQWAAAHRSQGVGWVRFPADWKSHGKGAGPIRNQQMLDYLLQGRDLGQTVGVLAFPFPDSVGTLDMLRRAKEAGVACKIVLP